MRGPSTPLPRTKHRSGHSHEAPGRQLQEPEQQTPVSQRDTRGLSGARARWRGGGRVGDREGCPCRAVSSVCLADPFLPVPPAIISPVPFLSHQHSVPNPSPPRTPRLGSVPGPPGTDPHRRPPHVHGGCRAGGRGCAGALPGSHGTGTDGQHACRSEPRVPKHREERTSRRPRGRGAW